MPKQFSTEAWIGKQRELTAHISDRLGMQLNCWINSSGQKISMTAPVSQQASAGKWAVSFMMPAGYTLAMLPVPDDNSITLRQVPARRMAAIRYSGTWSEKKYLDNRERLESWIRENGFEISGEPLWARYNPPFTLWFLRRNEILIPVVTRPAS